MAALGYIRISTEEQSQEEISPEAQRAKIEAYCHLKDLNLAEIIEDAGKSAFNLKREGIQRVMALVEARKVDAVVVYKLDRLSRSVQDILDLAKFFDRHGVAFHSITEHLDTKSAMGKFFFTLMVSLAQMERY